MVIYLALKESGLTEISLNPDTNNLSWGFIILIGLVAGFSTCMALVGGLILGLSTKFAASHSDLTARQKFVPHIFFGLFNLGNGYTLASLEFNGTVKPEIQKISDSNVVLEDGVQIVTMTETNRGYQPNSFTIKKGIPVRWIISAQAPYSCASALIVPKYKIRAFLKAGENIVEFTPNEIGIIPFSCSMGMYTGSFKVIN